MNRNWGCKIPSRLILKGFSVGPCLVRCLLGLSPSAGHWGQLCSKFYSLGIDTSKQFLCVDFFLVTYFHALIPILSVYITPFWWFLASLFSAISYSRKEFWNNWLQRKLWKYYTNNKEYNRYWESCLHYLNFNDPNEFSLSQILQTFKNV